jgi:hypothetical protein
LTIRFGTERCKMDIETSDLIFETRQITKNYPGTGALKSVVFFQKRRGPHTVLEERSLQIHLDADHQSGCNDIGMHV